jgi:hypothetical protein
MPLEPLQTDEKLSSPAPKTRDMDTVMLFGCGSFVVSSFTIYLLSVWPFFVFQDIFLLRQLVLAMASGLIPAAVGVAVFARRAGLPGAAGAIAGGLVTGIFLFLRLQQAFVAAIAKTDRPPEFPDSLQGLIPLGWVLSVLLIVVLLLPKKEWPTDEG